MKTTQLVRFLQKIKNPVYILDGQGVFVFGNEALGTLTGVHVNELIGGCCRYHTSRSPLKKDRVLAALAPPPDIFRQGIALQSELILDEIQNYSCYSVHFFPLAIGDSCSGILAVIEILPVFKQEKSVKKDISLPADSRLSPTQSILHLSKIDPSLSSDSDPCNLEPIKSSTEKYSSASDKNSLVFLSEERLQAFDLHRQVYFFHQEQAKRQIPFSLFEEEKFWRRQQRLFQLAVQTANIPVLISGPDGSGKSHCAEMIHEERLSVIRSREIGSVNIPSKAAAEQIHLQYLSVLQGQIISESKNSYDLTKPISSCFFLDCSYLSDEKLENFWKRLSYQGVLTGSELKYSSESPGKYPISMVFEKAEHLSLLSFSRIVQNIEKFSGSFGAFFTTSLSEKDWNEHLNRLGMDSPCPVQPILLPSLNARKKDIPLFAQCFLEDWNSCQETQFSGWTQQALDLLTLFPWKKNLDELKDVVFETLNRAAQISNHAVLADIDSLPPKIRYYSDAQSYPPRPFVPVYLDVQLDQTEKETILETLQFTGGNRSQAAQFLGITRPRLYRLLEKHGLTEFLPDRFAEGKRNEKLSANAESAEIISENGAENLVGISPKSMLDSKSEISIDISENLSSENTTENSSAPLSKSSNFSPALSSESLTKNERLKSLNSSDQDTWNHLFYQENQRRQRQASNDSDRIDESSVLLNVQNQPSEDEDVPDFEELPDFKELLE